MAVSDEWSFTRSFLRRTHNREVNEYFRDIDPDFIGDNTTGRNATKRACLILPNESQNRALLKILTFRYVVQQVHLKPAVFGLPVTTFQEQVRYLPQIIIHYRERADIARANNRYPLRARYAVRYRGDVTSAADLALLENRIFQIFDTPTHYFDKGRFKFSYRDPEKGYSLVVAAAGEADAKDVINKMLDLNFDTPDWDNLTKSEYTEPLALLEGTVRVGGELHRIPKKRPSGRVYFQTAELSVWGMPKNKILYTNGSPRQNATFF
ncbi:hypothetical protein [Picosynechococcus sp. PCC 8807]|uniref:hypothetical protein n=1 Tax=Picosynechococcus sp. PCC 8807 TaxID=195248 RepID=UPI0008106E26|nr:hypothetical protein [Picosynechococcus sp. PCC 8807]ANV89229.1 hypothetical protein AWQ24_00400 [Picosynechococcus sp. PCC 8807]